jgi:hypothetical protein
MAVLKGTMWLVIKITRNIITVTMMNKIDLLKPIKTATTKNKNMIASLMKMMMIVIMLLMLKTVLKRLTTTASDLCLVSARFEPSQGHRPF